VSGVSEIIEAKSVNEMFAVLRTFRIQAEAVDLSLTRSARSDRARVLPLSAWVSIARCELLTDARGAAMTQPKVDRKTRAVVVLKRYILEVALLSLWIVQRR
jgi:hypothetical protein